MANSVKINLEELLNLKPEQRNRQILNLAKYNEDRNPKDSVYMLCGTFEDGILLEESFELFLEESKIQIVDFPNKSNCIRLQQDNITYITNCVLNSACCDGDQLHVDFSTLRIQNSLEIL